MSVETHEELRVLTEIRKVCLERGVKYYEWDAAAGMNRIKLRENGEIEVLEQIPGSADVPGLKVLQQAVISMRGKDKDDDVSAVVVIKDAHIILESRNASVVPLIRQFRNMTANMKGQRQALIFVSPQFTAPVELQKEITPIEFALPTETELKVIFNQVVDGSVRNKYPDMDLPVSIVESVASAATGMTSIEAENAFSFSLVARKALDGTLKLDSEYSRIVFEQKISAMENSFLEYTPVRSGFDSVGGLTALKLWAKERRVGFDKSAREMNLPLPKGVLIGGFQGCGKTVTAMAISYEFGFPLFKLDMGKLFGSKVGETEANTRSLIRLFEGLGRACILIDEMEKSFNQGAVSGQGDSGASSRSFGTLLSWMSLKTCPIFFIGTVNDIGCMPPALTRRGRFDAVFWVDLPQEKDRMQIFNALMKYKFKRSLRITNVRDEIVEKTKDYSGAEIEALIEDSLYSVLHMPDPDSGLYAAIIAKANNTTPQAQSDPAKVGDMRNKVLKGFIKANGDSDPKPVSVSNFSRGLEI